MNRLRIQSINPEQFHLVSETKTTSLSGVNETTKGSVKWRSPSNIALIKYWGKRKHQIPANPSLSFTLQNAYSETSVSYNPSSGGMKLTFYFEGKEEPKFKEKIQAYLVSLFGEIPFLNELELTIESSNSFPHSAGIASSASGMSALALCLCSMEQQINGTQFNEKDFLQRASYLARLGSGSAARSVYGGIVTWGTISGNDQSGDEFASPFSGKVHEAFHNFHDDIFIVSKETKSTSSSQGHALMDRHPYAEKRYEQANNNLIKLSEVIEQGDLESFCSIVENEALSLHALMLSSVPSVMLLKPNTIEIINRVKQFRESTGFPVCITLDAGPNVHVLYPDKIKDDISQLINEELVVYCEGNYRISDKMGNGPVNLLQ